MEKSARVVLGLTLAALAIPAMAQTPTPEEAPKPLLRPFGSVPLMVPPREGRPQPCDTACLTDLARRYVDAQVRQDGASLPWAQRVRFAENGVPIMVGDGTWATATAHGPAPLIVADAEAGKVVWLGSLDEHGQPAFHALELTARGDRIARVAALTRRKQGRPPFGDPLTFRSDPAFAAPVATGKETPRAVMRGLVHAFFDAQGEGGPAPAFAKGCRLIENGVPMTGNLPATGRETGDCATSFTRGLFGEFEGVRRRIVAYDATRGLVVATGTRDLPAERTEFTATDGKSYKAEATYPRSVGFMSVFKIEGGAIARVETIATELPYLMPPPWPEPRGPRP